MKAKPAKVKQPSKLATTVKPKTAKTAAKAVPTKVVAKKAVAKAVAKPAPRKVPSKVVARPPTKTSSAKRPTRPAPSKSKTAPAKPVAPSRPARPEPVAAAKTKSTTKVEPAVSEKPIISAAVAPSVPVQANAMAQPVAQRAGRPSSRLASLTVPSMAQSVASTAAKASYSQLSSAPLIVPPLPTAAKKDPKLANNWKTKSAEQLSDAELLAMPDTEYMNDKQMAAFRLKLVTLKKDILNSAGETTEHLREDTVVVPDPADRATIEEEHALELRTRDRERKLLKKIEQSINRIDSGDYGYCDETGEPIGVGRLLARPTATLSLEAQQRRELKQKMFGD